LGFRSGDFPVAEQAAAQVLSLPLFPELSHEQQRRVVNTALQSITERMSRDT
jgi:dTDP-4-amino-4,6-dideoxygalactose transaminase